MTINNPSAAEFFAPGKEYYLDFSEAPPTPPNVYSTPAKVTYLCTTISNRYAPTGKHGSSSRNYSTGCQSLTSTAVRNIENAPTAVVGYTC